MDSQSIDRTIQILDGIGIHKCNSQGRRDKESESESEPIKSLLLVSRFVCCVRVEPSRGSCVVCCDVSGLTADRVWCVVYGSTYKVASRVST
jgi:hypothetical protein